MINSAQIHSFMEQSIIGELNEFRQTFYYRGWRTYA